MKCLTSKERINQNAINKVLVKQKSFIFNKLFSIKKHNKQEFKDITVKKVEK